MSKKALLRDLAEAAEMQTGNNCITFAYDVPKGVSSFYYVDFLRDIEDAFEDIGLRLKYQPGYGSIFIMIFKSNVKSV